MAIQYKITYQITIKHKLFPIKSNLFTANSDFMSKKKENCCPNVKMYRVKLVYNEVNLDIIRINFERS